MTPPESLADARAYVASLTVRDLVEHHARLCEEIAREDAYRDGYVEGLARARDDERRKAIFAAVENHRRAWIEAGRPPLPARPESETVETLRRRRRRRGAA